MVAIGGMRVHYLDMEVEDKERWQSRTEVALEVVGAESIRACFMPFQAQPKDRGQSQAAHVLLLGFAHTIRVMLKIGVHYTDYSQNKNILDAPSRHK